jgi:hypothetical protein
LGVVETPVAPFAGELRVGLDSKINIFRWKVTVFWGDAPSFIVKVRV